MLVLGPLLVPLATAMVTGLLASHARLRQSASFAGILALLAMAIYLVMAVAERGEITVALGGWPVPFGIALRADGLSGILVLTASAVGAAVLLAQLSQADPAQSSPTLHPLIHGLLAAVTGAFLAADLFNLYVWFELMLLCAVGLLAHGGSARHLDAALKYLVLNLIGTFFLLAAVGLIYGVTGHLNFDQLQEASASPAVASRLPPYLALLFVALLLKAGAFPLFAWLPASYHTLPAPLLALFGGLLTKVGAYTVLRLTVDVFSTMPIAFTEALGWLAVVTMFSGVLGAAYHWDLRRILAFHIVSQIGYLLLGVALHSAGATAAVLVFLVHNIVVKSSLFLIAGLVCAAGGHYDVRRLGGLSRQRPGLAILFALAALALIGVPPTSGFWGKLMLIEAAFGQGRWLWGAAALATGLLTLYSMSKIWLEAFWRPNEQEFSERTPRLTFAFGAAGILVAISTAMGLFPEPLALWARTAASAAWGGQ